MSTIISAKGGLGSWTVRVNGKHVGHVSEGKDGKFAAIRNGKVLGRFNSKVEATDRVAAEVLS